MIISAFEANELDVKTIRNQSLNYVEEVVKVLTHENPISIMVQSQLWTYTHYWDASDHFTLRSLQSSRLFDQIDDFNCSIEEEKYAPAFYHLQFYARLTLDDLVSERIAPSLDIISFKNKSGSWRFWGRYVIPAQHKTSMDILMYGGVYEMKPERIERFLSTLMDSTDYFRQVLLMFLKQIKKDEKLKGSKNNSLLVPKPDSN